MCHHNDSLMSDSPAEAPRAGLLQRLTVLFLMALLIVETAVGNSLVVCSVAKFRRLRSQKCFHLLASLAVADIAIAAVVMSSSAAYVFLGCWPFGDLFCKFFLSCDIMCCTASILHLCLISLDRYIAVNKPLQYRRIVRPGRIVISVAAVWAVSVGLSFGPVFSGVFRPPAEASLIGSIPQCRMQVNKIYAVVSASTSFFLPLGIMTVAYARVHRIATRQWELINRQQLGSAARQIRLETKATKTLGLVLGCFYVCWLPFFVMYVACSFTRDNCMGLADWHVDLITWVGYLNSGLNPILYCFNQREFRCAFQQLLGFRLANSGYLRSDRNSNNSAVVSCSIALVPRRAAGRIRVPRKTSGGDQRHPYLTCPSENASMLGDVAQL